MIQPMKHPCFAMINLKNYILISRLLSCYHKYTLAANKFLTLFSSGFYFCIRNLDKFSIYKKVRPVLGSLRNLHTYYLFSRFKKKLSRKRRDMVFRSNIISLENVYRFNRLNFKNN